MKKAIPLLVPSLPTVDEILPYLRKIDENRIYTNYGPLSLEFTARLAQRYSSESGQPGVTLTSSGTTAIELALRLRARPNFRYCLMPSFTFIATAHAVANAGLEPFFCDVDASSLSLTPEIAHHVIDKMPARPAVVLVVSPFGAPPPLKIWEKFEEETGIPVVFDAAAAAVSISTVNAQPQCVSLHATKALGIGEGGAILSTDSDLIAKSKAMTGFGFTGEGRVSTLRGGNYRISEYDAAIGLAVLSRLDQVMRDLQKITGYYANELRLLDVKMQNGVGHEWVTMTFNVIVPTQRANLIKKALDENGIPWRHWWGMGCHSHPAFAGILAGDLTVTNEIAPRVIGLPFHRLLSQADVSEVCQYIG